jgi:UDP-glucose 4-epimerase
VSVKTIFNYLVTGGAGFIGSNIVDRLIKDGHNVVVIDNESSKSNDNFYWNDKAKNYKFDICDYVNIRPLFENIDFVFHLAAESRIQPTIENPLLAVKTNSLGTATVLQCSREASIKRLVYSSTSSAYGLNSFPNHEDQLDDCLNPYSVSKVSGEKLCTMYSNLFNLETIILRYFNVYGPRNPSKGQYAPVISIFNRQKNNNEPLTIVGDGEQKRDFTHVYDVVDANILSTTSNIDKKFFGTIFNIGSGKNYSINEIAKIFNHETINITSRLGESRVTLADNSKAKNILNWNPKFNIKDYIENEK